jgi:hypothetical protein
MNHYLQPARRPVREDEEMGLQVKQTAVGKAKSVLTRAVMSTFLLLIRLISNLTHWMNVLSWKELN